MIIRYRDTFDAAHWLENLPETHKCSRLHGHTFRVTLVIDGPVDPDLGWVIDFAMVGAAFEAVVKNQFDHTNINDTLNQPTCERLAEWIALGIGQTNVVQGERKLISVIVSEGGKGEAEWRPGDDTNLDGRL